jgi:hypothetical protein
MELPEKLQTHSRVLGHTNAILKTPQLVIVRESEEGRKLGRVVGVKGVGVGDVSQEGVRHSEVVRGDSREVVRDVDNGRGGDEIECGGVDSGEAREERTEGGDGGGRGFREIPGQEVSLVLGSWFVFQLHVGLVGCQVHSPSCLTPGQIFLTEEVDERTVISVEGEGVAAFQVVPEGLDSMNHSQQLLFMYRVVTFSRVKFPALISYRLGASTLVL